MLVGALLCSLLLLFAPASCSQADDLSRRVLATPEGALVTIFHSEKDFTTGKENEERLLRAVKEDCEHRGIGVDSTVSCFCAILRKDTPKCLCSSTKSSATNSEGEKLVASLLLSAAKEKVEVGYDDSLDNVRPDVRLLAELNRLATAIKSIPNGLSASGTYFLL
jgi:hypothetical protein